MCHDERLDVVSNLRMTHHEVSEGGSHIESSEFLGRRSLSVLSLISSDVYSQAEPTYDSSTPFMNCRIGMNVVLVLEVVKLRRKVVAADTGAAKSSYSSW